MSHGNKLTPLAAAQPGMVLSDALLDGQGQVLLAQGTVLTEGVLASLGRHGVEMLPIGAASAAPADPEQIQKRLDHLFRHNERDDDEDWATGILRRYIEDYRLGRGATP
jgi:hypothetical protein